MGRNLQEEIPSRESELKEGLLTWCECIDLTVPESNSRVSQHPHYWYFGFGHFFLPWETVLCFVVYITVSLASTHQMPPATPLLDSTVSLGSNNHPKSNYPTNPINSFWFWFLFLQSPPLSSLRNASHPAHRLITFQVQLDHASIIL